VKQSLQLCKLLFFFNFKNSFVDYFRAVLHAHCMFHVYRLGLRLHSHSLGCSHLCMYQCPSRNALYCAIALDHMRITVFPFSRMFGVWGGREGGREGGKEGRKEGRNCVEWSSTVYVTTCNNEVVLCAHN